MYREIGIYGGTFSPPHTGHVRAATEFFHQLRLERLYIIPTAIAPHKRIDMSDNPSERLMMLHLTFEDNPDYNKRIFISDYEITQSGISYTAKTLEHFSKLFKMEDGFRITVLCGTDMFLTLAEWYKPELIFKLSRIAYIRREAQISKDTDRRISERTDYYKDVYNADIVALAGDPMEICSTDIRRMLAAGKPVESFINTGVQEYITKNGLYTV